MEIRRLPISEIEPAYYNPRKDLRRGDAAYDALARGIEEFGLVEPLVWNEVTGRLVGGHQRLKVLTARGETEADVSVVHIEDERREKALNVALNKIQGEWDMPKLRNLLDEIDTDGFDMQLTGFSLDEMESLAGQIDLEPDAEPSEQTHSERLIECPKCGFRWSKDG